MPRSHWATTRQTRIFPLTTPCRQFIFNSHGDTGDAYIGFAGAQNCTSAIVETTMHGRDEALTISRVR